MKPAAPKTKSLPIARLFSTDQDVKGVMVVVAREDGSCDLTTFSDSVSTLMVLLGGAMSSTLKSAQRIDDPEGRGKQIADMIEQAMNHIGIADDTTYDPTKKKAN